MLFKQPLPATTAAPFLRVTPRALAMRIAFVTALSLGMAPHVQAQSATLTIQYDIPAGPLAMALNRFAQQSGVAISMDADKLKDLGTQGVKGSFSIDDGFAILLRNSGYAISKTAAGYVLVPAPRQNGGRTTTLPVINVTAEQESAISHVNGYIAKRSATGSKTNTPLIETPQSITVITADRITAVGATTLKDALGYTPGVGMSPFGADSRYDWITVRGFDAYSPGFYMDGLPLRNNNNFGVWKTDTYGAERIEILRGPSSVLYGLGNPGGVVNVVSKRPTVEPLHELQAQVGDHNRRQIAGDFSGPLDSEGKLLYRITGVARDAQLSAGNMDNDYTYIAPALTWKPSSDTSLTLLSQFSRTRAGAYTRVEPRVGSLLPTAIGTYVPSSLFIGDGSFDRYDQDQQMIGYQFEHRLNDTWTVRQNARYAHLKVDYAQVSAPAFATINPGNPLDPVNFQFLSRSPFGSREDVSAFSLDNQIQADVRFGDWQHQILLGLDYQRTRIEQAVSFGGSVPLLNINNPVYGGPITLDAPYSDGINHVSQTGVYIQDQMKWRDRWVITLGGRYDDANNKAYSRLDDSTTRLSDHKFTGRAGLVYLAPNGWAPYVSYTESFAPTGAIDPVTSNAFNPETGRQYEAGVRYQPPGKKQSYSAAVFDLRRQNYITYDTFGVPKQTGEISVRGLEFEAITEILPNLNLIASYDYTPRAIVTASSNIDEIGKQAMAVPRHKLSVWADYRFRNNIKAGLGARYTGWTYGDGEVTAPNKVPGYTLFDAMISYDIERWTLALNLRNLTDKTYLTGCAYGNCYYGDQRTAIATATYRW